MTWKTTADFLSHFNLESLKDLPGLDELKAAGLLDTRPVLATMRQESDGETQDPAEDDFAAWMADETEIAAAE